MQFDLDHLAQQHLDEDAEDVEDAERACLRAERNRLASLPIEEDRIEPVDTGKMWAGHWAKLEDSERGKWLRDAGVKIWALNGARFSSMELVEGKAKAGPVITLDDAPIESADGKVLMWIETLSPLTRTSVSLA